MLAKPLFLFHNISKPIRFLAEIMINYSLKLLIPKGLKPNQKTTEEEFAELIDWAYRQGVLEKSELEIMEEIIKLDKRTAEEVMKPRSAMICIEDNCDIELMISEAKKYKFTRLPIFHDKPDNIVGILNTRHLLLNPESDLSESIEFPSYVPATMNLMDLLKSLRMQRRGLAIVIDEFGGTAGLITIEDVLEELVGEMRDEGEKTQFTIEKLNKNRWRVNGTLPVEDFQKKEPRLKGLKEIDTMGGLITALKEVVPKNGESAEIDGYELTVVSGDDRSVKELVVKKLY
jgi:CBS domain containing-hemolysin-like protein